MEESVERASQEPCDDLSAPLPPFDKALGTRKWCIVGLGFCYILSTAFICTASVFWSSSGYLRSICPANGPRGPKDPYYPIHLLTKTRVEVSLLALNLLVTLATECVGYIHATSLRWALYHEGRLRHNSNLRLFTSAKHSMPNRWFVNALWLLAITVSYSCASQLVMVPSYEGGGGTAIINSLSLLILGCCLFLLSLLATWTLVPTYSSHILTWNSDPLNTALATQHVRLRNSEAQTPAAVRLRQSPMMNTSRGIKHMLIFLWLLVPSVLVASIVTWIITGQQDTSFISDWWDSQDLTNDDDVHWPLYLVDTKGPCDDPVTPSIVAASILFVALLQFLYTIALHVAEQFANLHRDERAWRHASKLDPKKGGALIGRDATKAAVTAWPTVFLFAMKPVCHWIFGLSFPVDQQQAILYHPLPLFTLAAMAFLLASCATYLALRQPAGPQPSAFGNVERLVGMIDDWGKGAGHRIYWGEKSGRGEGMGARRVGTSGEVRDITEVKIDGRPYLGMKEDEVRGKGVKRKIGWCF